MIKDIIVVVRLKDETNIDYSIRIHNINMYNICICINCDTDQQILEK